jgi:hypothetical protein
MKRLGEAALIAFIIAEILYLFALGYLKAPVIVQPKAWTVPCCTPPAAAGTERVGDLPGCWRTATAPVWSEEERDFECAV